MLEELRIQLRKYPEITIEKRGDGLNAFLYLTTTEAAVEASMDENSEIWVEFWVKSDEESDDPPVEEQVFSTVDSARAKIIRWLIG